MVQRNALQRMQLKFRNVRVTVPVHDAVPGSWLRRSSIGAGTARLAQAIAARYVPRTGWASQERMVYPAVRRPLALSLRLALTLLHWPGMPGVHQDRKSRAGTRRSQENLHWPGTAGILGRTQSTVSMPALVPQLLLRPAGFHAWGGQVAPSGGRPQGVPVQVLPAQARAHPALTEALPIVRRLARRGERVPMVGEGRPGMPGQSALSMPVEVGPAVPPVPRTVRTLRSISVLRDRLDASELQRAMQQGTDASYQVPGSRLPGIDAQPSPWPAIPGAVDMGSLDPAQVGRLADRVVQVIDDRIMARRERLGRV